MKKELNVLVAKKDIEDIAEVVKREDSRDSIVGFTGLILKMINEDWDLPYSYKKLLKEKVAYLQLEVIN